MQRMAVGSGIPLQRMAASIVTDGVYRSHYKDVNRKWDVGIVSMLIILSTWGNAGASVNAGTCGYAGAGGNAI